MRWLAIARFRFLVLVRRTKWIFPFILLALVPPVAMGATALMVHPNVFRGDAPEHLRIAGFAVLFGYLSQMWFLISLCWSFGVVPRRPEGVKPLDLMDAAPVSGQERFWGDTIGILGAVLALHVSTTPVLALIVAQSPFPSSVFWFMEIVLVAMLFMVSAMASWSMRAEDLRWSQTRSARAAGLLVISLILIIGGTTRVDQFMDAVMAFFNEPSRQAWGGILATFQNPALFIVLLVTVMGMFVTLYSVQAARSIDNV